MFTLEEITTEDGLIHQGILAEPEKKNGKAIVWVHGLTSTFYNNTLMLRLLAQDALKHNIAFASFNSRGHDMVTDFHKIDPSDPKGFRYVNGGSAYEEFTDCVYDIDASVTFLKSRGYSQVFLIGHSTGAQKVGYYAGVHDRPELRGIVLACPMSDRLGEGAAERVPVIEKMKKMVAEGKGDELVMGIMYFPITPKRYLSLFSQGSAEDHYDYGDPNPQMKYFSNIKKPVMVIFAEKDEHADRPIAQIKKVFDGTTHSQRYQSIIIRDSFHGFDGKEPEVIQHIIKWIAL